MGMKSTAVATATFAGTNGATYYASPDAAPYVLGFTGVIYLVFVTFMAVAGMIGFLYGNFQDEGERNDFIAQISDPEARERMKKKKKGFFF